MLCEFRLPMRARFIPDQSSLAGRSYQEMPRFYPECKGLIGLRIVTQQGYCEGLIWAENIVQHIEEGERVANQVFVFPDAAPHSSAQAHPVHCPYCVQFPPLLATPLQAPSWKPPVGPLSGHRNW